MKGKEEHRIRDIYFKSNSDFRRWRFRLIRMYLKKALTLCLFWKKETTYSAFLLEVQKADSFESLVDRYNSKIFKECNMTITHRPSGSMCIACKNFRSPLVCPNQRAFRKMQPIKKDKCGMIVVKCVEFEREEK